jgi:hypothetical protein
MDECRVFCEADILLTIFTSLFSCFSVIDFCCFISSNPIFILVLKTS